MEKKPQYAIKPKCVETFDEALLRAEALMISKTSASYEEIHAVKSSLYAAVERVGLKAEKTFYAQRMLRELLVILSESSNEECKKGVGLKMLKELQGRYRDDIFLS